MYVANEKDTVEVEAVFADVNRNASMPTTVHWRLDCETTGRVLRDWTTVEPVSTVNAAGEPVVSVTFDIDGSLNAIQSNRNARELKKVLIVADKDLPGTFSKEVPYYVMNLRGK